jgi:hypothetical protein
MLNALCFTATFLQSRVEGKSRVRVTDCIGSDYLTAPLLSVREITSGTSL